MSNYKLNEQMVAEMSECDKSVLLSLYLHRCLTASMIVNHFYQTDEIPEGVANHRIDAMILDRLLEAVPYDEKKEALFLTEFGVKTVVSLYEETLKKLYKPGSDSSRLPSARDLKMFPTNINHQLHLNQFGLEFEKYAQGKIEYKYFDEKFMPPASDFMMPDGMISLPNRLLFLEMDMGTERIKRLAQKWNSYRMFLNSPKLFYENKPITMFFLLDGISKISFRQKTVIASLMTHLGSRVNKNFEAYFETPERCHEILQTRYFSAGTGLSDAEGASLQSIRVQYGFQISKPPFLTDLGFQNAYYIKRIDEHGKINMIGRRPQEFILDLWLDQRFSIFQSIAGIAQTEMRLRKSVGREVPYLLVVNSPMWAKRIPSIIKAAVPEQVFFTSPERLKSNTEWHNALFQIDQLKNLNHFQDDSLAETVHELRMAKL